MSNSQNSDVEALERLLDANLNLGSPIRAPIDKGPDPPTIKKTIRIKLKQTSPAKSPTAKSPTTNSPAKSLTTNSPANSPAKSPANSPAKSVDVSFETPVFDFSQVLAELERTEEAGSAHQKEESCVSVSILPDILADILADEPVDPISTLPEISADEAADPISADEAADPVSTLPSVSFATPNYSRWLVPIDFTVLVPWVDFAFKEHFVKVADIQLDEEVMKKSTNTKKVGEKARQTFIRFVAVILKKIWSEEAEWIYVFVVDGLIVKIGGTRTGLLKRCGSYLSGHGIPELGGNSNSTNAKIYWTFFHQLLEGKKIEMRACRLPEAVVTQTVFGSTKVIRTQCFHDWEAFCLEEFAKLYGSFPPLSDNCDPRYRKATERENKKTNGKGKKKTASK